MRVLYVTHSGLIGGAERALLDQLAVLPSTVIPTVACPPGPLADALRATGIDVADFRGASGGLRLHPSYSLRAIRQILTSSRELRRITAAAQPDVVHANSLRAGLIAGGARLHRSIPTIVHVHDALPHSSTASLVHWVVRSTADAVITISEFTAQNFASGASRRNVHVLHNPLDTELFDPATKTRADARAELGIAPATQLIGLVAQITPWKDQELAIRALSLLHERHPEAHLILVGEAKFVGPAIRFDNLAYLRRLRQLVAELGLERHVALWGERTDVPTIVRALDVLIGPSWEEPFGRSVIEAMAMETAVVSTNVGGPAEYIEDGVDGVLLPPRDVHSWADAVGELLDDSARRELLGRRASPKVRTLFERRLYTDKVVQLYHQVIRDFEPARPRLRRTRSYAPTKAAVNGGARPTRLRIMFVEHSSVVGGGQQSLLELLRVLRQEHEVLLACPPGPLAEAAAGLEIPIEPIPESQLTFRFEPRASLQELARALHARMMLGSHIRRLGPDVIHANSLRAGLLTSRFGDGIPTVVHCRDLLPPGLAAAAVRRTTLATSSMVVAVSRAVAVRLAGEDWARRRVAVIDNPVDSERFDPQRFECRDTRRLLGVDGTPVLGVIGQITPWKGQLRALRVLDRVRESHPDARLLIVGETKFVSPVTRYDNQAYERTLHQAVERLGLQDAVSFLGEREDVERVMATLDVLLVPSTEEPFGRSVIEAMAMGVPVIATNRGGPAEVVRPSVDGVVLAPDDVAAWAQAVVSMSQRGRRLESRDYARERFSPGRHAAEVAAIHDRVVAGTRLRSGRPGAVLGARVFGRR